MGYQAVIKSLMIVSIQYLSVTDREIDGQTMPRVKCTHTLTEVKRKDSVYERRLPVLGSQSAGDRCHNLTVGCHYFPQNINAYRAGTKLYCLYADRCT